MKDATLKDNQIPQSLWQLKPWWCQPWSIVTVGIAIPAGSWLLLHRLWLTAPIALGVGVWWWVFLVLVPQQYAELARSSRERQ